MENVTIITERFKVLFYMSDIGHSRVLSKSHLYSFSAPSGCVLAVGCPWTSFSLFMAISTVAKRCGRESPGCYANIQVKLFINMKGYCLAIHVQSKKLVAYYYCIFIPSDLPINEPVFRKVDQREKVSQLLLLSGRLFYR